LLIGALQEKMNGLDGCKVLLVYPRQVLAKNQLERLARYLAAVNQQIHSMRGVSDRTLTLGIVFGETPRNDEEVRQGGHNNKGHIVRPPWQDTGAGHVLPYFTTANGTEVHVLDLQNGICTLQPASEAGAPVWQLEGFRATRQAIRNDPPDVLIITTEMLHR